MNDLFWLYREETDPVGDLVAHRELMEEMGKALQHAEADGDYRRAVLILADIQWRKREIRRLESQLRVNHQMA